MPKTTKRQRPHKLIAFAIAMLATGVVAFANQNYPSLFPSAQQLQSISMLKLIELNKKYGVASVIDLYREQTPSQLAAYLNKKTVTPIDPVFRVLEANGQKSANEIILNISGHSVILKGLSRSNLEKAIEEYASIQEVGYAEPNYLITLDQTDKSQESSTQSRRQMFQRSKIKNQPRKIFTPSSPQKASEEDPFKKLSETIAAQFFDLKKNEAIETWGTSSQVQPLGFFYVDSGLSTNLYANKWIEMGSEYTGSTYVRQRRADTAPNSHGTHVGGIIAATAETIYALHNREPKFRVVAYRGFEGKVTTVDKLVNVLRGLSYDLKQTSANELKIISASWGSKNHSNEIENIRAQWNAIPNTVLVAATGNDGNKTFTHYFSDQPEVIAVTAVESKEGPLAPYANFASDQENLVAAPGGTKQRPLISTGGTDTGTETNAGTSQATPYVAALIGVLKSLAPNKSVDQIIRNCTQTRSNAYTYKEISYNFCK